MINYLNQVTQTLNTAADIIGRENTTLSGQLRMIASAKAFAVDRFMILMARSQKNSETGKVFSILKRPQMPDFILSDESIEEVVKSLLTVTESEKILSTMDDTCFTFAWYDEKHVVQRIQDGARVAALLLEKIVRTLQEGDQGPYYCTHCLESHEQREDCQCGMSKAWLTPWS